MKNVFHLHQTKDQSTVGFISDRGEPVLITVADSGKGPGICASRAWSEVQLVERDYETRDDAAWSALKLVAICGNKVDHPQELVDAYTEAAREAMHAVN